LLNRVKEAGEQGSRGAGEKRKLLFIKKVMLV
jgi:hypothetical protein